MKKIRCEINNNDYIKVREDRWLEERYCAIDIHADSGRIILSPAKIRKLRKQLKQVLIEIERDNIKENESCGCGQCVYDKKDKEDDWFSVGKKVKIVNRLSGHGFKIGQIVKHAGKTPMGNEKLESLDGHSWYAVSKDECVPA